MRRQNLGVNARKSQTQVSRMALFAAIYLKVGEPGSRREKSSGRNVGTVSPKLATKAEEIDAFAGHQN